MYWYMLETTVHLLDKNITFNDATHAKVDFLYHYLAREHIFLQGMEDIYGLFTETQERIDAAEEANAALEDKKTSTAYSSIAIRMYNRG